MVICKIRQFLHIPRTKAKKTEIVLSERGVLMSEWNFLGKKNG